jgi:hypothetical protein
MKQQQIIAAFEQAEYEFSKNYDWTFLCNYFNIKLNISNIDIKIHLSPLWQKYRTVKDSRFSYHFKNRAERLYAIRQVLNDLKNEQ